MRTQVWSQEPTWKILEILERTCNPNIGEAESGRLQDQVLCQWETLFQTNKNKVDSFCQMSLKVILCHLHEQYRNVNIH